MSRKILDEADWDLQRSRLDRYFRNRVHDENDAEDLTHEVIEHAFAQSHSFDPSKGQYSEIDDQVGAWLNGIAGYKLAEFFAQKKRVQKHQEQYAELGMQQLESFCPTPESRMEDEDIVQALQEAWESCSPALKKVAKYKFEGMSNKEIAKRCNTTVGNVQQRISRFLRQLREQLDRTDNNTQPQVIFASEVNYYQAMNQFLNEHTMEGCSFGDDNSQRNYIRHVNGCSDLDEPTGDSLKNARRAIERGEFSEEDQEYLISQLNELTIELQKRKRKPTAIARYWNHIKEVAPTVASILSSIASISKIIS